MYLEMLTDEWILLALGMGVVLVFIIFLSHLEGARPRPKSSPELAVLPPGWKLAWLSLPWLITLLIAGSAVFGLMYYYYRMMHPPTW